MSIILGTKLKYTDCGTKRKLANVKETMVYVAILKTFQHIWKNAAVLAEVCINKFSCHSVMHGKFSYIFCDVLLGGETISISTVGGGGGD